LTALIGPKYHIMQNPYIVGRNLYERGGHWGQVLKYHFFVNPYLIALLTVV